MNATVEPARDEADLVAAPETVRGYRSLAFAGLTAALIGLCVYLTLPFLPALAWGVALAVIAWPLQTWVSRHVPRRGLAAALTTAAVITLIVVPGMFVAYHIAREAGSAAEQIQAEAAEATVRDKLAGVPGLGGVVAWLDRVGVSVDREVRRVTENATSDLGALVQGSLMAVVQFAVAMFILYFILLDRDVLRRRVRALLPMTRDESDRVMRGAGDSIHANLYANFLTSVVDGIGGGLVFWAVGLPSPVTWGVVMFFLSFIPMFGTWLAWLPAALYLGLSGQVPQMLVVLAWGMVSAFGLGGLLYTRLAGDRMRLHQVPTLLAFLGGLSVFGVSGMVLGPVILAVTVAVLDVWHDRAIGTSDEAARPESPTAANGRRAGVVAG